jgi:hypothetical protein
MLRAEHPVRPSSERLAALPPPILPVLYLGTAHVSLALACALVAWWPRAVAGFFYHSWMVAIVHLLTLGWITCSILGAVYIVGPVALQMPMPAGRGDYAAFAMTVIGVIGMVAHFWIEEFGGMAWSAATVTAGVLYVAVRLLRSLPGAKTPSAVKLHIVFACVNVLTAASAGVLMGFDKVYHFLPGFVLSNVLAHAHLAAVGWATMMVVGVGYRLLPMTLPARPPEGPTLYWSALLIEGGVLGLFASLVLRSAWAQVFGPIIVVGLAAFAAHVVRMVRTPRRRPPEAPSVDFAVLHAAAAGLSLVAACGAGLWVLFGSPSDAMLHLAVAYGVFGLLGFLAQMVVAMEARLVPLYAWYRRMAATNFAGPVASPHVMRDRRLQAIVFAAWAVGVPAVAAGLGFERLPLISAGAWALLIGVSLGAVDNAQVLVRAVRGGSGHPAAGFSAPRNPNA